MLFLQREILKHKQRQWRKDKKILEKELQIEEERAELISEHKKKRTTSKSLIWFLFINCSLIELFVAYTTIRSFSVAIAISCMPDLTPLTTLIGAVVGEVIGFAVYSIKAAKENSKGGITYDMAMMGTEEVPSTPQENIPTDEPVG